MLSSNQVCKIAGCSYRQLDYWCRFGLLGQRAPGSGYRRNLTAADAALARAFTMLAAMGAELPTLATVAWVLPTMIGTLSASDRLYVLPSTGGSDGAVLLVPGPDDGAAYMLPAAPLLDAFATAHRIPQAPRSTDPIAV